MLDQVVDLYLCLQVTVTRSPPYICFIIFFLPFSSLLFSSTQNTRISLSLLNIPHCFFHSLFVHYSFLSLCLPLSQSSQRLSLFSFFFFPDIFFQFSQFQLRMKFYSVLACKLQTGAHSCALYILCSQTILQNERESCSIFNLISTLLITIYHFDFFKFSQKKRNNALYEKKRKERGDTRK